MVHTYLRAPQSRMDILSEMEIKQIISMSELIDKYNKEIDRESAYEILSKKIEIAKQQAHQEEVSKQWDKGRRKSKEKSVVEELLNNATTRQIGRTVARELTRGLLGMLGIKSTTRKRSYKRRKKSWF